MDVVTASSVMEHLARTVALPATDANVKLRRTPFQSLVACLLSAQSRDANTAKAASALFAVAPTAEAISALDEAHIAALIRPSGLYNAKASNLKRLCRHVIDAHGGVVPRERDGLMAIPGIGRKCADIMLRFVFEQPVIAVDTHVFRVARRIGLSSARTADGVAVDLERLIPEGHKRDAHLLLLEHGKRVCRSRRPACEACVLAALCAYGSALGGTASTPPAHG